MFRVIDLKWFARRLLLGLAGTFLVVAGTVPGLADTLSFTASDIENAMAAQGAPLHNATYQWGIWAVRAMPLVTGGGYTITGGSTNQTGWGVSAPNGVFGAPPYTTTNSAWFWDASGSEVSGTPANPLYMIMDKPANTFTSYTFNGSGTFVGAAPPILAPGYDGGAGGTNVATEVLPSSFFDVFFTLDLGATWDGKWQFVVDGSKYTSGTQQNRGTWVEDYFGGYTLSGGTPGGGLANNMGGGFQAQVPSPTSIVALVGLAGMGLIGLVWRRRRTA